MTDDVKINEESIRVTAEELLENEKQRMIVEKNEEETKVINEQQPEIPFVIADQEGSNKTMGPSLKYVYKEDQWSPLNPEGKKQYDRSFLLRLKWEPMSQKKPEGLPDLEVIRDSPLRPKQSDHGSGGGGRMVGGGAGIGIMKMKNRGMGANFIDFTSNYFNQPTAPAPMRGRSSPYEIELVENWDPTWKDNNPKTIDQICEEYKEKEMQARQEAYMQMAMQIMSKRMDDRDRDHGEDRDRDRGGSGPVGGRKGNEAEGGWNTVGGTKLTITKIDPIKTRISMVGNKRFQFGPEVMWIAPASVELDFSAIEVKCKTPVDESIQNDDLKEIKLHESDNAWKPGHKVREQERTERLNKAVRGILNKLTPKYFTLLMDQVSSLDIDNEDRLSCVIDLVFEKAIKEPNFSVVYASMCKKLATQKNTNHDGNFRKLILTRCQKEFEKDTSDEVSRAERLEQIKKAETEEKRKELRDELADEERKSKRRSLGNIRFIGELFRLSMLTTPIMHDCLQKLIWAGDENSLECLCKLLTTIGKDLDAHYDKQRQARPDENQMNWYFSKMLDVVKNRDTTSRVKFMLQDVIDLRKGNWVPRRKDNDLKTIDQIPKDVEKKKQQTYIPNGMDDRERYCDRGLYLWPFKQINKR